MNAVLVSRTRPEMIVLLKGNMPLEVRWHRHLRAWAYAAETAILARALADIVEWETVPMPAYHALIVNTALDISMNLTSFAFGG